MTYGNGVDTVLTRDSIVSLRGAAGERAGPVERTVQRHTHEIMHLRAARRAVIDDATNPVVHGAHRARKERRASGGGGDVVVGRALDDPKWQVAHAVVSVEARLHINLAGWTCRNALLYLWPEPHIANPPSSD